MQHAGQEYDLSETGQLLSSSQPLLKRAVRYEDGSTIDWLREETAERDRVKALRTQRGVRGVLGPAVDSSKLWLVLVLTGIGIGVVGAWLDVLVKWLGDLREGRCAYGFFYNQVTCCQGVSAGEICTDWQTWSQFLNIRLLLGASLLQTLLYVSLAALFAGSSAVLVTFYAPYAFHTGIPEIKAILGGYVLDAFLSPWTLVIKSLGLALAVASGLSLGKEGPLVHVACCMAVLLSKMFKTFRNNEAQKRKILAAAAAAGVSVAFGSPLGGVLFGLEELDTFSNESDILWRAFVTSVIAAMALQYVDPFGTAKLVLFQVTSISDKTWRAFELVPWIILAIGGGVLGSMLIRLNVRIAVFRRNSVLHSSPIMEVLVVSAVTAAISYLIVFCRVPSSELVANLFQECDPSKGDYHGLCNPTAMWENVFLLLLTAALKIVFTSWTFGMMVPAGIFLPTIAIGACLGRAIGLLTQGLQRAYPAAWVFSACPPDPTVRCISPGFYAVIGASAMLGGVTRMTISLVVILFELTGALSHVIPIMISVMTAKWIGDALGTGGIYTVWISMRNYPWLPSVEWKDKGQNAATIMIPYERLVVIEDGAMTLEDLVKLLNVNPYHGFPVVREEVLIGYVTRDRIKVAIRLHQSEIPTSNIKRCVFSKAQGTDVDVVDMTDTLDQGFMQLRKEVSQEFAVNMFQKLNLTVILFTSEGRLAGLLKRADILELLNAHFPENAALSQRPNT